jgi:flavodoxin
MKIGIVVHSNSGHTQTVAEELRDRLASNGLDVTLHPLKTAGTARPGTANISLRSRPTLAGYDRLVIGSPVNGGKMSAAMAAYLNGVPSLKGQQVAFLLTHFFRRAWGAEQTIERMAKLCESKGAGVMGWADVRWPNLRRRRDIRRAVDKLAEFLSPEQPVGA